MLPSLPKTFTSLAVVAIVAGAVTLVIHESRSFRLQARLFANEDRGIKYWMEAGPSPETRSAGHGPYDHRLGYAALPNYLTRLKSGHFAVASQARISPALAKAIDWGLFAPYKEKPQAGLSILDCRGDSLYSARYPERLFPDFARVPPVLVNTLLFIENRELLDEDHPRRNPAVEWDRLAKAMLDQSVRAVAGGGRSGGSTLATQIEKYRHSPEGRTPGMGEKLRQMVSATLRAYLDGEETLETRKRIVVDYLNTVPLAARPGYGEVNGLGDGLWAWFGRDWETFKSDLASDGPARAQAYKEALALMISQRRPSWYLRGRGAPLEAQTNTYLRLLAEAGILTTAQRDAALAAPLRLIPHTPPSPAESFTSRKAVNSVRVNLAALMGTPTLYEFDRLDLTTQSTLDGRVQDQVTAKLQELRQPEAAKAAGLLGEHLLGPGGGDPSQVIYSFTLYERTPEANLVRVQADNLDQPLDINNGVKMDLGSTSKLRTLISYLEIVEELHDRYATLEARQLRAEPRSDEDPIGKWALEYLEQANDKALAPMLEAALERHYSANPGEAFFTGSGLHHFANFDKDDNRRMLTVREGLRRSVNLVFIRLMRDVVRHTIHDKGAADESMLKNPDDPLRQLYLLHFADKEGKEFLRKNYTRYHGHPIGEALDLMAESIQPTPRRLTVIFRSVVPEAGPAWLAAFLSRHLPPEERPDAEELAQLYRDYGEDRFSLADRAFLSRVHPLALWLLKYLGQHPNAGFQEAAAASYEERQSAYAWLMKPNRKPAQDKRIRTLVEEDAFHDIHRRWKRLGYPFDHLVPSYASALGASADRPAALAELMGILQNDGVRLPLTRIQGLHFAADTPYDTTLAFHPDTAERVLSPEIARVTRGVLAEVVSGGTAVRLKGVFRDGKGAPLVVGGKTGTGDHRFKSFNRGGGVRDSVAVERSGVFVFYLGERHFGTLTAYVSGPGAAKYQFTSGLPVQILKVLAPVLAPAIQESAAGDACGRPGSKSLLASAEK